MHVPVATVSEVPTTWLCLQHDLRLAGLDPAHIRRMPDRAMPDNLAALRAGVVYMRHAGNCRDSLRAVREGFFAVGVRSPIRF
jgi:hypothetical protein